MTVVVPEHKYFDEEKVKQEAKMKDKELSMERAKEKMKEQEKIKENDKKDSDRLREHEKKESDKTKKDRDRYLQDDSKSRNSSSLSAVKGDQSLLSFSKKYKNVDTTESNTSLSLNRSEKASLRHHNSNRKESLESTSSSIRNESALKSGELSLNHVSPSFSRLVLFPPSLLPPDKEIFRR